jgi:hypothetical protein
MTPVAAAAPVAACVASWTGAPRWWILGRPLRRRLLDRLRRRGSGDVDRRGTARRDAIFWGLKGDGAGKEARAGPTCQHPWRTDKLYASGADIPEAYNTSVRLRCWHVGSAT